MSSDAWITLVAVVAMVVALASERVAPVVAVGAAVSGLYLAGIVDLEQAFGGFATEAPITVAALYVLAGGAEHTGALSGAIARVLGARRASTERQAVQRVATVTAAGSAFVPNTPVVALMIPNVEVWARRQGISPSRLLMPLSYAAVLGGVITVLGTSTNLVVNALLREAGEPQFRVFEITPVGLPIALAGVATLVALSPVLLPRRSTPVDGEGPGREYTIEMVVTARGAIAGTAVADAAFAVLEGVSLATVERLGTVVAPVPGDFVLDAGDHLLFTGPIERIHDLEKLDGLVTTHEALELGAGPDRSHMFEAVVDGSGPLAGDTLKALSFHERHGATVLAIHRAGEPLTGSLGDVVLRGGDVLVVVAEDGFRDRTRDLPDFLVVAPTEATAPVRRPRGWVVQAVVAALLVATGTGWVDLAPASVAAAWTLVLARVVSPAEAVRSVNMQVIALVGLSFGLGAAAAESGLAAELADLIVAAGGEVGAVGVLAGTMLATMVLTELLSNNAAAALMFPVAASISAQTGTDLRALALGVLVMASCSFLSPIGYQTNTMVWSMGGYRFGDFPRLGVPLTAVVLVASTVLIPLAFPLSG